MRLRHLTDELLLQVEEMTQRRLSLTKDDAKRAESLSEPNDLKVIVCENAALGHSEGVFIFQAEFQLKVQCG